MDSNGQNPFIEVRDLRRVYRTLDGSQIKNEQIVFDQFSLDVEEGEFVAVVGPSGCGKSTLLHMIGGLDAVEKRETALIDGEETALIEGGGEITVGGFPLSGADGEEKADFMNRKVGFIFQSHHLIPELDALQNVTLPLLIQRVNGAEARRRASKMLRDVGLGKDVEKYPKVLSGGEKQRVAIARALVTKPLLVLADEPTGSLDPARKNEIFDALRQRSRADEITVILVTHDVSLLHDPDGHLKVDRIVELGVSQESYPSVEIES